MMMAESQYCRAPTGKQQEIFLVYASPELQSKYVAAPPPKPELSAPPHATIPDVNALVVGDDAIPIEHAAPPVKPMAPSAYCAPMSEHDIAPGNNKKKETGTTNFNVECKTPQVLSKNKPTSPADPNVPKPKIDPLTTHKEDAKIIKALKYTTLRFVHNGPFSRIYLVKNDKGMEFIAKVESKEEPKKTLGIEAQVYKDCSRGCGIPVMFQCCEVDGNRAIIIQKLGVDLSRIQRALPDRRFSPADSLNMCMQTFYRIWELHNNGWLHRDIKPSNFVIGAPPDEEQIYILDFGLSRPKSQHARPNGDCPVVGTSAYRSICAHNLVEYRAKDDLESWFYMCCHLITGTLPWLNSHKDWMVDYKQFCKASGRQQLVGQLPSQFDSILNIIHRSKDTVDYYKISALLKSAIAQYGQRNSGEEQCAWKRDPSIIERALELSTEN